MAEPKKRSTPKRIKAPLSGYRSGFDVPIPEKSRKFWDAWQKRMEKRYPTPKLPKPRPPPPEYTGWPRHEPEEPGSIPRDKIRLLKGPKGEDMPRGVRKREEDPSAKRLGTYQSKPAKAPAKKGVKAKVRGAAKTVGRRAAGFLAGHRLVRGARAAAGSKVGKAVGRGIKEIATSRRPPTRPPQIGRRLYERFRSAPRSARKRSK